jgi:hypothetical protein
MWSWESLPCRTGKLDIFAEKTFIAIAHKNVTDTHDSASGIMISSIKAEI